MERLVALVPRPRVHLTRYHGVLAPHYKYRKNIIPKKKEELVLASAEPVAGADAAAEQERPSSAKACGREDPKVIKQILEHLGLPSTAPRLAQARGPPQTEQSDFFAQEFAQEFFED